MKDMACFKLETKNDIFKDSLYFEKKNISLYNADVLNASLFASPFINLIVTSPPYNVGIEYNSHDDEVPYQDYLEFSKKWMSNCYAWAQVQCRFCLNIPLDKNKGGARSVGADFTKLHKKLDGSTKVLLSGMKAIYLVALHGAAG